MKSVDSPLTPEEITALKQYFIDRVDTRYLNWATDDQIIDHRYTIIPGCPEWEIVKRIVAQDFSNPIKYWSALQKQTNPHGIHIDDFGSEQSANRYTYVFALDTVPEFKTIIWKEKCWDNDALHEFLQEWGRTKSQRVKTSNISETEDLEHTYDENVRDYLADYLTLDGIFSYKAGEGVLFDASQLHTTSNWRKYPQFDKRELLQIHVISDEPVKNL